MTFLVGKLRNRSSIGAMVAMLLSSGAYAQVSPAPQSSPDASADEAITVTGTRIRRPDLASNSPITSVTDQEIKYQGAVNVESVLNRLPQFTADANENVSNGSDGTANINLRNLGSNRVLTLINGQRLLPQQATDLNFVPSTLIERIDVVTGGASAVYGSDALSGVVNFVLRDNLDGIRADVQAGVADHTNDNAYVRNIISQRGFANAPRHVTDGGKIDANLAVGKSFADDRGNITAYVGYRHTDPVLQSNRDVSACALQNADDAGTALECGGSSNTPFGTFNLRTGPMAGNRVSNAVDGSRTWVPYDAKTFAYNYSPTNYFQRSDERITGGGFAHFKIAPIAEVYGSVMYMRDRTFSQVAPSALFLGTVFNVPCDNPLLSAGQAATLCGPTANTNDADATGTATTKPVEIGYRLAGNGIESRRDFLRHSDYRYTAGVRGDLGSGFSYDVGYLHSLVRLDETYMNNVDNVKAQKALDVVNVNGVPTCRSVVNGSDPACIPANVFQAGGLTSAAAQYLFSESNTFGRNTQTVFSGTLNGDLGKLGIKSPFANDGIGIAIGVEHRRETLLFTADAVAKQGGINDADGNISVNEGYGEIEIPILQDKPFFKSLTLNGGARYSDYTNRQDSTGYRSKFNAFTYKGELSWEPVSDVRLRGSYNRAIRAPNISELFAAQQVGNVSAQDPCAGKGANRASLSICQLTGVTSAQYSAGSIFDCPAETCSALGGGNRNLKPEKGDTYTVGMVLTPRMVRNLTLTVDYFHIKVNDYISSVPADLVISQCTGGDAYYCGLFHRDPSTGQLYGSTVAGGYIVSTTYNTGFLKTSGIDVTADYTVRIGGLGRLNLNMVGTWLASSVAEPLPGLGSYDCKGLYGYSCGQPSPVWRHVARATWLAPQGITASIAWRHLDSVGLSSLSSNTFLNGSPSVINAKIPAYDYFDLAGTITIDKGLSLRAGINNMLDKNPPAIAAGALASFGNGNTYPGVYDVLGRTLFVGATVNF
ncbi:TonB-dependent receptor [Sphingomonas sp. Leaf242]|nr:TonB-dependent receptor [Sphingomonas sp. Leaf242]